MMDEKMTVDDLMVMGESLRKHALATASVDELLEGEKGEEVRKQAVAATSVDELLEGEKGEEVRKQAVATASVDERLAGIEPEQRLVGLDIDDMQALMQQIEHYLATQEPDVQVAPDTPHDK